MNTENVEIQIDTLAKKATETTDREGTASLKFSQAALNLAHALATLEASKIESRKL